MCGASMTSRGGFHWRFALSVPITISVALAMAFIPVGDAMLGFIPIFVATNVISFVLSTVFLTTPIFHSDAHKTFGRGLGLPMMVLLSLFFTIVVGYVELTRTSAHPLVGLVLPAGCFVTEFVALKLLKRSLLRTYYEPKQQYITRLMQAAPAPVGPEEAPLQEAPTPANLEEVPPLVGDMEMVVGYTLALFALVLENAKFAASVVEVMFTPTSRMWIPALVASTIVETSKRTAAWHRFHYALLSRCGMERFAPIGAHKVAYTRSQDCSGLTAIVVMLSIGCLRAISFGDWHCIIWMDVSKSVSTVLAANAAAEVFELLVSRGFDALGWIKFPVHANIAEAGHPLDSTDKRYFDAKAYPFICSLGCMFILLVFVAYLGPSFTFGLCPDFHAAASDSAMVSGALNCSGVALADGAFLNSTLS
jgi:hypothetical protein